MVDKVIKKNCMVDRDIKKPIIILSSITIIGAIGYHLIEGKSLLNSFYWTIVTITTVGYGDLPINTPLGKIFAIILIITSVGVILYTLTILGENIIEGRIWKVFTMREKQEEVEKLSNHMIVCGYGDVGEAIKEQLEMHGKKVVVIDKDEEKLRTEATENPYIVGDATEKETLKKAGADRAEGIFAAMPQDSDNILIILNAIECNKNIRIIARSERTETDKHLEKIGADTVVHPDSEGGIRMAQSFLNPEITNLYDSLFKGNFGKAGTIDVSENSDLVDKTIAQSGLKEEYGLIVAIKRDEDLLLNPSTNEKIKPNDTLIVIGKNSRSKSS